MRLPPQNYYKNSAPEECRCVNVSLVGNNIATSKSGRSQEQGIEEAERKKERKKETYCDIFAECKNCAARETAVASERL
jgi:hypothetical protein